MNTQSTKRVLSGIGCRNRIVQSKIPESDLSISAARNQFPQTTSLHVDVCNPLLVFSPYLDHGRSRLQTLVKNTDGTVTETGDENVAGNLV